MVLIDFDYDYLEKNVCSNVKNAIIDLENAYDEVKGGVSCPSGFFYKNTLNKLPNDILKCIEDLKYFNEWLEKCNTKYEELEKNFNDNIKEIDVCSVDKRNMII